MLLAVVGYLETGFNFSHTKSTTVLTSIPTTSTIPSNVFNATTTINYAYPCNGFELEEPALNAIATGDCNVASNSILGLWVASGNSSREFVTVIGADNKTYINQSSPYDCVTLYKNFTAPAQRYLMTLRTAPTTGGNCGSALVKLNTTTVLPITCTRPFTTATLA